ncbi:MAG: zinc ribbon domain-containing protein [Candidatus Gastranaerophilales bacterium]|nr:zinc ribbon domain-containing protein [Candidatus Gastranaerophilales bacterium]
MPSYDYRCNKCHEIFTVTKSMNDSSTPTCPCCGSNEVAKVWGNVQLKGCCKTSGSSSGGGCSSCSGGSCGSCH